MNARCVVFDFFGVICSEVAPFWLPRHFDQEQAAELKADLVGAADRGDIDQATLFERLSDLTGEPPAKIESDWFELARIDLRVVTLARSLGKTAKLGLLTNSPSPFIRALLRKHDLEAIFDAVVVSSEHGCAKPDRGLFDILLANLAAAPADTVFIDDNPINVDAAAAIGMSVILFTTYEDLALRLGPRATA